VVQDVATVKDERRLGHAAHDNGSSTHRVVWQRLQNEFRLIKLLACWVDEDGRTRCNQRCSAHSS
jgi:hypothetical protein